MLLTVKMAASRWCRTCRLIFFSGTLGALAQDASDAEFSPSRGARALQKVRCNIDRLDAADPAAEGRFAQEFYGNKPVLISNVGRIPEGFQKQDLKAAFGKEFVAVNFGHQYAQTGTSYEKMQLSNFLENITAEATAGRFVFSQGQTLNKERLDSIWQTPAFRALVRQVVPGWAPFDSKTGSGMRRWKRARNKDHCPAQVDGGPCFATLTVGGIGAGIPMHFHMDSMLQVLYGEKYWLLCPGDAIPSPGFAVNDSLLVIRSSWGKPGVSKNWLECLQQPGETLYVPEGWYHGVMNLKETVAVGMQVSSTEGWLGQLFDIQKQTAEVEELERQEKAAENLVEEHPTLAEAWLRLTKISMGLKRPPEKTKRAAMAAAEANPRSIEAQVLLAKAMLELGEPAAANQAFARAEELAPLGWSESSPWVATSFQVLQQAFFDAGMRTERQHAVGLSEGRTAEL